MNDRLLRAALVLATGEKDARSRVAEACIILRPVNHREFSDSRDWEELKDIIESASRYGPLMSNDGIILRSAFEQTAKAARNCTASKLAKRIFRLYMKDNGIEL